MLDERIRSALAESERVFEGDPVPSFGASRRSRARVVAAVAVVAAGMVVIATGVFRGIDEPGPAVTVPTTLAATTTPTTTALPTTAGIVPPPDQEWLLEVRPAQVVPGASFDYGPESAPCATLEAWDGSAWVRLGRADDPGAWVGDPGDGGCPAVLNLGFSTVSVPVETPPGWYRVCLGPEAECGLVEVVERVASPQPTSDVTGHLPDGSAFHVILDPAIEVPAAPRSVSAAVMVDLPDGSSTVAGVTTFVLDRSSSAEVTFEGRTLVVPAGEWTIRLAVYPEVLEALGPEADATLLGAAQARNATHLADVLGPPLRWASDEEVPIQMLVDYGSFVVMRGCGGDAVACSETRAVQVVPADLVYAPAPAWPGTNVFVESDAPRPATDAHYLDPGPLGPRGGHDVIWTGKEMIVWGGADGDRPPDLVGGAAFDPASSTWRPLPPAPLRESQETRAVWSGTEMIVVSSEATVAYDPVVNAWRTVADGATVPRAPGLVVHTGHAVVTWGPAGIEWLEDGTETWARLPDVGFGDATDGYTAALRVLDGKLYAIGNAPGTCEGRVAARWDGAGWLELPKVSLLTGNIADCSYPNQTASVGGRLVIWEDDEHATMSYDPATDEWSAIATIPLPGTEGAQGPVALGDRILVPQWGTAALFDPETGEWTPVDVPGGGSSSDMVWTGEEILMWGNACCYGDGRSSLTSIDAWRRRPGK